MTTTFAPYHVATSELVSVADLGADDVVAVYGALFRIVSREIVERNDLDRPVYVCRTEVLDGENWTGPAHWLNDWIIQGTSAVSIARMAQGIDFDFIAAGQPGGVAARMHG